MRKGFLVVVNRERGAWGRDFPPNQAAFREERGWKTGLLQAGISAISRSIDTVLRVTMGHATQVRGKSGRG
jgi:hypothetical protein